MKTLVIYGSTRRPSNSALLADKVVEGIDCTRLYLTEYQIKAIVDKRHDPEGFKPVDDDYDRVVELMLAHDRYVFATPLYWYGMSGPMKDFFDRWSQALRDPRYNFREAMAQKQAWVVIVGGESARIKGLPLVQQFQYICDFVKMPMMGYVIGQAGRPGDILQDERALAEAASLNQRLRNA